MCSYVMRPLARPLVRDQVADAVRQLLLSGQLEPGTPARELEIAEQLGVSRNPVREALVRLQEEGLLVSNGPQRGLRVREPDEQLLYEVHSLRALLEGFAAERAARFRSDAALSRMRECVALMGEAGSADITELSRLDIEFHRLVVLAAGHSLLYEQWRKTQDLFRFVTRYVVGILYERAAHLEKAHLRLIEPIADRDSVQAGKLARRHVDQVLTVYRARQTAFGHGPADQEEEQ